MADAVLIYPETGYRAEVPIPPFSILFIGGALEKNGFSCKLVDTRVDKKYKKTISEAIKDASCVGISCMTGYQIYNALDIAEYVRKIAPEVPIIWGGVHPTLLCEQTIRNELVDIIVQGEGEATMLELVKKLKKGDSINSVKGIVYKKQGKVFYTNEREFLDMNELLPIPWHLLDFEKYIAKKYANRTLQLHTSRGCPHRCGFCYNLRFNRSRWRCMSTENVLDEIQRLKNDYNIDSLRFCEDEFFTDRKRVEEICKGLIERGIRLKWSSNCRINYFAGYEPSFLKLLRRSGCVELTFGGESGSQRILDLIKKGITVEQTIQVVKKAKAYGIGVKMSFMMALPTETEEEMMQTFRLIDEIKKIYPEMIINGVLIYTPYPGTPLYESFKSKYPGPSSLEGWGHYAPTTMTFPWVRNKRRMKNIHYIARFALSDRRLRISFKKLLPRMALEILIPMAKFRWKHKFFDFPIEWLIVEKYIEKTTVPR